MARASSAVIALIWFSGADHAHSLTYSRLPVLQTRISTLGAACPASRKYQASVPCMSGPPRADIMARTRTIMQAAEMGGSMDYQYAPVPTEEYLYTPSGVAALTEMGWAGPSCPLGMIAAGEWVAPAHQDALAGNGGTMEIMVAEGWAEAAWPSPPTQPATQWGPPSPAAEMAQQARGVDGMVGEDANAFPVVPVVVGVAAVVISAFGFTLNSIMAETAAAEKAAAERARALVIAAEAAEKAAAKKAAERAAAERAAAERAAAEKAAEKAAAERAAAERAVAEKATERAAAEKAAAELAAAKEAAAVAEKVAERAAAEKAATELAAAKEAAAERVVAEMAVTEKVAAEKVAAETAATEKVAEQMAAAERAAAERRVAEMMEGV